MLFSGIPWKQTTFAFGYHADYTGLACQHERKNVKCKTLRCVLRLSFLLVSDAKIRNQVGMSVPVTLNLEQGFQITQDFLRIFLLAVSN